MPKGVWDAKGSGNQAFHVLYFCSIDGNWLHRLENGEVKRTPFHTSAHDIKEK